MSIQKYVASLFLSIWKWNVLKWNHRINVDIYEKWNIHIKTHFRKLNWINGKNKLTYLIEKFSKRFYVVINEQNLHLKTHFGKITLWKTSYPYKKKLPVVAGWWQYRLKAKLEVKNFPLAERTWKLKNHTILNLFWRPLSLDNVGSHITTNSRTCNRMQHFQINSKNDLQHGQHPSSQRHGKLETKQKRLAMLIAEWSEWWFQGCQMSLSLPGRVFAFKSTGSFIEPQIKTTGSTCPILLALSLLTPSCWICL